MTVYGYCRVSRERQVDKESLGVQTRQIVGYAMMKDMTDPVLFVEKGETASIQWEARTEGAALLAVLKPGDAVIITAIDRAFRSAIDALTVFKSFVERGIQLHVIAFGGDVTADGPAKLVFGILALVAEDERDRLIGRIRTVKRDQAERGRFLGGTVPFGWRMVPDEKGGHLVQHIAEQSALARAEDMRRENKSLRDISAALALDGHKVSHNTLGKLLRAA